MNVNLGKEAGQITSERNRRNWADPAYRKRMTEVLRRNARRNGTDPEWVLRQSTSQKKRWDDPVYRRRACQIRRDMWTDDLRRERSEQQKHISNDPSQKENYASKMRALWRNPDYHKKMVGIHLKSYAEGRSVPNNALNSKIECGWLQTEKGGRFWYQGSWERVFAETLDKIPMVIKFSHKTFPIPYTYQGVGHSFFPDFVVNLGREVWVVELKGRHEPKARVLAKCKVAKKYCEEKGFGWALITEAPLRPLFEYFNHPTPGLRNG